MPGRDGYEVCEFVKKSPELSHVPVLLVASDMEPYDGPRGEQVGADGIIKKPFEARDLISIVEKFAEQFEAATIAFPAATDCAQPQNRSPRGNSPLLAKSRMLPRPSYSTWSRIFPRTRREWPSPSPPGKRRTGFLTSLIRTTREVQFNAPLADAAIFPESAFEPPSALAEEQPLAAEAAPAPSPFAPSPAPPYPERAPSFPEGLEATTPEPVFTRGTARAAPRALPRLFRTSSTTIFRAPLEIAEPALER